MELSNSFTVPAGIDQVWDTVMDIERVAPCMPGATLESYDGEQIKGKVKVRVGPVQMTYTGTARFVERDRDAHRAVVEASGREARGSGTAAATVSATLHAEGEERTRVEVATDLTITGKAAQFGRGVLQEVAGKIVGQFADTLAALISAPEPAPEPAAPEPATSGADGAAGADSAPPPAPTPSPRPAAPQLPHQGDAIDLLDTAGAPVLKRAAPVAGVLGLLLLVWWLLRRRRD